MTDPDAPAIPQPRHCRTTLTRSGDRITLSRRAGGVFVAGFRLLWLIGWSAGCAVMFYKLVTDFEWFFLLFAIPFFVAEIAVGVIVLWSLFGRQVLTIDRTGATVESRLLFYTRRKSAPLHTLREIEEYSTHSSNDRPVYALRLCTTDRPITFGFQIDDDERAWLLQTIQSHLDRLGVHKNADAPEESPSVAPTRLAAPTSGARWKVEDQIRYVTLTTRGRLEAMTLAGLTFFCLFWNGIVGVFFVLMLASFFGGLEDVVQGAPEGGMRWFLFFFLIPFEIVGLVLFVGWLNTLLAPWTTRTWTLDQNELRRTTRRPLWRWTRRWATHNLARTETGIEPKSSRSNGALSDDGHRWRIRLIDASNSELATISGLSEAQAAAFNEAISRRFGKR